MYNLRNNYYNGNPYDNHNTGNGNMFHQRSNSMKTPLNLGNNMGHAYPYNNLNNTIGNAYGNVYGNGYANGYGSGNGYGYGHMYGNGYGYGNRGDQIATNMNSGMRKNSFQNFQSFDVNGTPDKNYAVNKIRRNASFQSLSKKSVGQGSSISAESNRYSEQSEPSIYMNNKEGNNIYHITCSKNGQAEKRIFENKERNKSANVTNCDYGDTEDIRNYYRSTNQNNVDVSDVNTEAVADADVNVEADVGASSTAGVDLATGESTNNIQINIHCSKDEDQEYYEEGGYVNSPIPIFGKTNAKIGKPKKIFMGKYFLKDIKKSLLAPMHLCGPHPTLVVPNPNIICYGITPKERERQVKPEIIVRY